MCCLFVVCACMCLCSISVYGFSCSKTILCCMLLINVVVCVRVSWFTAVYGLSCSKTIVVCYFLLASNSQRSIISYCCSIISDSVSVLLYWIISDSIAVIEVDYFLLPLRLRVLYPWVSYPYNALINSNVYPIILLLSIITYVYTYRERERDLYIYRERDRERERKRDLSKLYIHI